MSLSPEEIEHKQFRRVADGYDSQEVDGFLGAVAERLRTGGTSEGVDPFSGFGEHIAELMRSASATADQVKADAHEEASRIRARAATEAAEQSDRARSELDNAARIREAAEREAQEVLATASARADALVQEARADRQAAEETLRAAERAAKEKLTEAAQEAAGAVQMALEAFDAATDLHTRTKDSFQRHAEREHEAAREQASLATVAGEVARAGAEEWEALIAATRAALERAENERQRAERETAQLRATVASQTEEMLEAARQHLEAVAGLRSNAQRSLETLELVASTLRDAVDAGRSAAEPPPPPASPRPAPTVTADANELFGT